MHELQGKGTLTGFVRRRYKKRQAEETAERDAHQMAKLAKRPPPTDDSSVFD